MKKLFLILFSFILLSFKLPVPKFTEKQILDAISNYKQFALNCVPKNLKTDTIEYQRNDTIFILRLDYNYIPWVVEIKRPNK